MGVKGSSSRRVSEAIGTALGSGLESKVRLIFTETGGEIEEAEMSEPRNPRMRHVCIVRMWAPVHTLEQK